MAVYTLSEVAAKLHKGPRWLQRFLRGHTRDARGRPLFRMAGRTKLFTDEHVATLIESLPCPLPSTSSGRAKKDVRRTMQGGGRTPTDAMNEAREFLAERKRKRSSASGKRNSNVIILKPQKP